MKTEPNIQLYNMDCMELMSKYPDKHFELAIIDPEYGINASSKKQYHTNALTTYTPKKWDSKPVGKQYLQELFRVSQNQIIWGANYISDLLPVSKKWIVWDKMQPEGIDQAMFELAWQSQQNIQSKIYRQSAQSNCNKVANNNKLAKKYIRIHPTQKPIKLYKWLLKNYAKEGDKILDTHGGSMSIAIACYDLGFDLTLSELDSEYFDAGVKRFNNHKAQLQLF